MRQVRHSLVRVHSTADLRNIASWRVMEKLGMQREGGCAATGTLPCGESVPIWHTAASSGRSGIFRRKRK